MDIANQMILFAKVVEHGGFSAAARDLGQTLLRLVVKSAT